MRRCWWWGEWGGGVGRQSESNWLCLTCNKCVLCFREYSIYAFCNSFFSAFRLSIELCRCAPCARSPPLSPFACATLYEVWPTAHWFYSRIKYLFITFPHNWTGARMFTYKTTNSCTFFLVSLFRFFHLFPSWWRRRIFFFVIFFFYSQFDAFFAEWNRWNPIRFHHTYVFFLHACFAHTECGVSSRYMKCIRLATCDQCYF